MNFSDFLHKLLTWKVLIGLIIGAAAGYAYYHFVGCDGGCPITSNPWKSMGVGALSGILLMFPSDAKPDREPK